MNDNDARQTLYALIASQGVAVSPDAETAELVRLAMLLNTLPAEIDLALAETFDAAAEAAKSAPPASK